VSHPYDVAVVGAGPAGSTTANILAKKGFRTAIIERRSKIGLPIQCAELFPTPAELHDIFPRSKRLQQLGDVPKEFVTNTTSRTHLISPSGHVVEFDFNTNIIDRARYDQHLADRAIDAGCEIHLGSTVIDRSTSNHLKIRSKNAPDSLDAKIVDQSITS